MTQAPIPPMVLIILDGWGYREDADGNAVKVADTPVMDSLWHAYPHTLIKTSGKDVGLPEGQMGNSEVGHLNIGAGRVVPQELVRISDAIDDGSIQENEAVLELCQAVRYRNSKLHLIGLCSEGGVHSHLNHLLGLLEMAKAQDISEVCIHVITDGRDTKPTDGYRSVQAIQDFTETHGVGRIVTLRSLLRDGSRSPLGSSQKSLRRHGERRRRGRSHRCRNYASRLLSRNYG